MMKPLIVDWEGLKAMGWPYSRTHTERKMQDTIELSRCVDRRTKEREYWTIPNPDPFPKARKLGTFPNSPRVWIRAEVIAYFEKHGLYVDG